GSLVQPAVTQRLLSGLEGLQNEFVSLEQPDPLTDRETEILRLMAGGFSNKEIANSLGVAEGTVKNHVSNILSKLGVRDRTRAVLKAFELKLVCAGRAGRHGAGRRRCPRVPGAGWPPAGPRPDLLSSPLPAAGHPSDPRAAAPGEIPNDAIYRVADFPADRPGPVRGDRPVPARRAHRLALRRDESPDGDRVRHAQRLRPLRRLERPGQP